jgi:prepilin-type N-terminal cleavage/methylation domain-containing protein
MRVKYKYRLALKGFTLLEILLVIGAIGILSAIVLVAINPNRQLAQARDAQRKIDINTINKSLEQFLIDTYSYPSEITNNYQEICATGSKSITTSLNDSPSVDCTGKLDLRVLIPTYISSMPRDPQSTGSGTGYYVAINQSNNKISTKSFNIESSQNIAINDTGESIGSSPPPPPPPDPKISLLMNCNGSTFIDSSMYNRAITIGQGNPTISSVQSKFGGSSCLLNSTSRLSFIDTSELELTGDFTVETWAYPLISSNQIIFGHSSQNVQMFRLNEGVVGRLSFFLNGTQVFSATSAGISPNNWYHLAITRSENTTRMFVNGVQVGANNNSWTGTFKVNMIGLNWFGSSYTGYIDDFRITKGVARYAFNFTPPSVELANNDYVTTNPTPTATSSNVSLLMNCNEFPLGFIDSSGYQRKIKVEQGTPVYTTVQSKFGGSSCYFPGGSRVNFSDTPELELNGDFTIETWAYPLSSADQIMAGHSIQNVQMFRLNNGGTGRLSFFLNGTQVFSSTAAGITSNNWHHLAISRAGNTTRMFVNGVQVGSNNNSWTGAFKINSIGGSWVGSYNGYIDDFRITKGVARYLSNFTPPTAQLAD